jgi:hypothetical protein
VTFVGDEIPRYAILSHTWDADDEEFTYQRLHKWPGKKQDGL